MKLCAELTLTLTPTSLPTITPTTLLPLSQPACQPTCQSVQQTVIQKVMRRDLAHPMWFCNPFGIIAWTSCQSADKPEALLGQCCTQGEGARLDST
eukprot:1253624-Alexandrium_andersonii.AAC.1